MKRRKKGADRARLRKYVAARPDRAPQKQPYSKGRLPLRLRFWVPAGFLPHRQDDANRKDYVFWDL